MKTLTRTDAARRGLSRRRVLGLLPAAAAGAAAAERSESFALGLSESVVGNVNLNDARAAMRVWINRLTQEFAMTARIAPEIFENAATFAARLRAGTLDTVAVTLPEYRGISALLDHREIAVPVRARRIDYVLLVRSGAGIAKTADLRGRRLILLESPLASVVPAWLWTLVHGLEPGGPGKFFGSIAREARPSRAILPVFFGQADACVTTGESLATMAELNPQIGKGMRTLAASEEIVPSLYGFRRGWTEQLRARIVAALRNLGSNEAGRQLLSLFQISRLESRDASCLAGTLAILDQAARTGFRPGGAGAAGASG